jgi:hypothetical protein
VVFIFKKDRKGKGSRKRPYNKGVCEDFKMIRKCSLCRYWERGKYHRDGKTPSVKGRCILSICSLDGNGCPMWDKATKRKVVPAVSMPRDVPSDTPVVKVVG